MNKNLFGTGKLQACKEINYGEEYVLFCLDYYGTIIDACLFCESCTKNSSVMVDNNLCYISSKAL